MKKYMCLFALSLIGFSVVAQPYYNAVGVRLGKQYGISLQQKVYKNFTVEGLFHYDFRNTSSISVVGKQYKKIILPNFNYYYGAGLHKGWIKDNFLEGAKVDAEGNTSDPFGITGVAGIEMTLGKINIGMDYRPNINIVGGGGLLDHNTAISVRYVIMKDKQPFKTNNKKKKRKKSSKKKPLLGKGKKR